MNSSDPYLWDLPRWAFNCSSRLSSALHPRIGFGPLGNHAASALVLYRTSQLPRFGISAPKTPPREPDGSRYNAGAFRVTKGGGFDQGAPKSSLGFLGAGELGSVGLRA